MSELGMSAMIISVQIGVYVFLGHYFTRFCEWFVTV